MSIRDCSVTAESLELKKARLDKIIAIQENERYANSVAWYLNAWNYCIVPMTAIYQGLSSIVSYLSPAALIAMWGQTVFSLKDFLNKKIKTAWDYAKIVLNLAVSISMTTIVCLGAKAVLSVAGVAAIVPALPYIAIGIFGCCALFGLFNFGKHIYRAIKTPTKEERYEHLKQAGKALLGIVVNTLAVGITIIFGIKLPDAIQKVNDAIAQWDFAAAIEWGKTCVEYCNQGTKMLIALTSFVFAGVVAETVKTNQETANMIWNTVRHPIDTAKQVWNAIKTNPLNVVKEVIVSPLRLATLVVTGPVHLLMKGAVACFNYFFGKSTPNSKLTTPVISTESKSDQPVFTTNKNRPHLLGMNTQTMTARLEAKRVTNTTSLPVTIRSEEKAVHKEPVQKPVKTEFHEPSSLIRVRNAVVESACDTAKNLASHCAAKVSYYASSFTVFRRSIVLEKNVPHLSKKTSICHNSVK